MRNAELRLQRFERIRESIAAHDSLCQDAKIYVEALLDSYRKFAELLNTAFHADKSFLAAMDKVFMV